MRARSPEARPSSRTLGATVFAPTAAVLVIAVVIALGAGLLAGCSGGKKAGPGSGATGTTKGGSSGNGAGDGGAAGAGDGGAGDGGDGGPIKGYTGPQLTGATNPLGAKWDWGRVDDYGPYLAKLSGGSTFFELVWCDVEPAPGKRDYSRVDTVATSAQRLGFALFLKIRVGSCWVNGDRGGHARGNQRTKTSSAMPDDLAAYQAFVTDAVTHFGSLGVHTWAIENEVNAESFWVDSAEQYEQLVTVAAKTIRAAQPAAAVLDAGISSTGYGVGMAQRLLDGRPGLGGPDPDGAVAAWQDYYDRRGSRRRDFPPATDASALRQSLTTDQAKRNQQFLDATFRLAGAHVIDRLQVHFYERYTSVPALMEYLRASLPAGMPIEIWEAGQFWQDPPKGGQVQAEELTKTVALFLAAKADRVIWLPLLGNSGGRNASEIRYGLLDKDLTVRPAGTVFASLALADSGSATVTAPGSRSGAVVSGGDGGTVAVLWADGSGRIAGAAPSGARVSDLGGKDIPWPGSGLELGSSPVVVTVPASGAAAFLTQLTP